MFKKLIVSPQMRRRVSLMIATVLLLPFILFFHASGRMPSGGPGGSAGILFGRHIPWEAFQQQRAWIKQQWQNQFGDLSSSMDAMLDQYTWDKLTILEEARRRRIQVDDRQLASTIEAIPAFQDKGRFVPERYHRFLRAMNTSSQTFETLLRNDLLAERLLTSIKAGVSVGDAEVKTAYREAHEQLRALLVVFETNAYTGAVAKALTEAEVRAYAQAHPDEFRIPEQVTLEYAGATRQELLSRVQLSDEDIKTYYQDHPDEFTKEDKTVKPLEEVKDTAKQRLSEERVKKQLVALALDLQDDLDAKLRFEEMVTARALALRTAGPVPVNNPWVPNGPEPAVLQAVSGLAEGQVSDVIHTDNGVYIARATKRLASRVPPFEEVRSKAQDRLVQQHAQAKAKQAAEALRSALMSRIASGMRFEEAAIAQGTLAAQVATFTRSGAIIPIGTAPAVNDAAFRAPLGQLTDVLDIPSGYVLLRPEARFPADFSGFAKEETALRQDTLTKKQSTQLDAWLKDLRERAKLRSLLDSASQSS